MALVTNKEYESNSVCQYFYFIFSFQKFKKLFKANFIFSCYKLPNIVLKVNVDKKKQKWFKDYSKRFRFDNL